MSDSDAFAWPLMRAKVLDTEMAYRVHGDAAEQAARIVFLHGNATNSFTWRKIAPFLDGLGQLIAPDLIGMGGSAKLRHTGAESYIYLIHRRYLDALLDTLVLTQNIIFITHGWGTALACDWAARHPGAVKGLCYMEAEITPLISAYMEEPAVEEYKFLRSKPGEAMALQTAYLMDKLLFAPLGPRLDNAEREAFFKPYETPGESRRPLLEWEREVPINGIPADTFDILISVRDWLAESDVPKLFVKAENSTKMVGERLEAARAANNQRELNVSAGAHPQEEAAGTIGLELVRWISRLS
ncbi:MAG: haloalkane dehalogenase [Rhodospirillaceae bacterium]|nr:haloalkane dehalogenase [Rhodospirillaceae bacterium]